MSYDDRAWFDPSRKGGGPRPSPALALGGAAGAIVVIVIALVFGVDPGRILRGGTTTDRLGDRSGASCTQGSADLDRSCRLLAGTRSLQDYWSSAQPGYQEAEVSTFDRSQLTGCGAASPETGPFYCPADATVYLGLGFFDRLGSRSGARNGYAAEAYVLAHTFGHHLQNLDGALPRVQGDSPATDPAPPRLLLELQADCYAGVWCSSAGSDPTSTVPEVSKDDLDEAVDAAAAVGDDQNQPLVPGQVTPESWTYGSAAQRKSWLLRGFEIGNPARCDTFAVRAPR